MACPKCPRCESTDTKVMATSPVGNEWEVYLCNKCFYSWRSTEEIHVSEKFRLNDEKIEHMDCIPPVPSLD